MVQAVRVHNEENANPSNMTTNSNHTNGNQPSQFVSRHIGPRDSEIAKMLEVLGLDNLSSLVSETVPDSILSDDALLLGTGLDEHQALAKLKEIAKKNKVFRSFIGQGFHDCITPPAILRNILENPGWYTQYTPYQPEISQGRLEALVNFQTLICELTGLPVANSSLLDEGTAVAEAMTLCFRVQSRGKNKGAKKCFVDQGLHPSSLDILHTRANPLGIEIVVADHTTAVLDNSFFAAIVQYPQTDGLVCSYQKFCDHAHEHGVMFVASADLQALAMLESPGSWGADVAVGTSQRLGVPLGFGGPHAGYMATKDEFKREIPGRIVGISRDVDGKLAYRLALQTREQHIKRERATSNICTAQVLLAIISGMYAVYHGPRGLRKISERIHAQTCLLASALRQAGIALKHSTFFDTISTVPLGHKAAEVRTRAESANINFFYNEDGSINIALDEKTTCDELLSILHCFMPEAEISSDLDLSSSCSEYLRTDEYLQDDVFNKYHSETELLRYITRLQSKDLSLATAMIPLGSCTMKLNAAAEMLPVTWEEFGAIHPFVPLDQSVGYREMICGLEEMLSEITGFPGISLQPNAGSQGEYAGLLVIREYFRSLGQEQRNVCLIPASAHGTNPASAAMAGMDVVVVKTGANGDVDLDDLKEKAQKHSNSLAALMITYPSTHGVFETAIVDICDTVHQHGAQVYMDGANLNAQVGLCRPGDFGIDVCHLNLHKTFCIPHGGGGPGVGPIGVAAHLKDFLPGHPLVKECGGQKAIKAVASAPWGSASILPIPWMYISMMGAQGVKKATEVAILNANYIAHRLEPYFPVLYRGEKGRVAHECIIDLRGLKQRIGVEVGDIARRLMDYGFHAPTVSFPVVETLMIEPTESESLQELDRFCDAMISIKGEIDSIESGKLDRLDNPLKNAPHTAEQVSSDEWTHKYSRAQAAYPLDGLREYKFWPAIGRIDAAYGDRNFCCTLMPQSCDENKE